ncbi:MAG: hypothetical protein ABSD64_08755 [Terriglobales bacterium]|jgi:hypothetical protein
MPRAVCYHRLIRLNVLNRIMAAGSSIWRRSSRHGIVHGVARVIARASVWILPLAACGFAVQPATVSSYHDPVELVRKAVQNEIRAESDDNARFLFRGTKTTPKGSTTKIYVETKQATAGLVVAYNGKALTPEQRRAEEARVERFVNHPEELQKKRNQERDNAERTGRIVRALPDAFLFEYAGEAQSSEGVGRAGTTLVRLKFRPNPSYQPPSRVEEILTGMEGYVLVDAVRCRLASIDGTLFKEVGFGWGILGHLDRGGRFTVQQEEVEDNLWEISSIRFDVTGKLLLVKKLSFSSAETFNGFKRVPPDLTFAQALEMLKKEDAGVAENSAGGKLANR